MFEIKDVRQIQSLASPMRQAIVDVLEAMGGSSAAELGKQLGCPADRLYYHLRALLGCGLVVEIKPRAAHRGAHSKFKIAGRPTRLRYSLSDPKNKAAISRLVASLLRDALRSFQRSLTPAAVVHGNRRTVISGRRVAWLTPKELGDLNRLVRQTMEIMEQRRPRKSRAQLYSFAFALSPFVGHGRR